MHLLAFSLLLAAAARSVVSQIIPEWGVVPVDTASEDYINGLSEEKAWPTGPVEHQNMRTTLNPSAVEEDPDPKESSVWKIALVGTVLLVSLLGSLSLAYYMNSQLLPHTTHPHIHPTGRTRPRDKCYEERAHISSPLPCYVRITK